jgi:hypothetical protein
LQGEWFLIKISNLSINIRFVFLLKRGQQYVRNNFEIDFRPFIDSESAFPAHWTTPSKNKQKITKTGKHLLIQVSNCSMTLYGTYKTTFLYFKYKILMSVEKKKLSLLHSNSRVLRTY